MAPALTGALALGVAALIPAPDATARTALTGTAHIIDGDTIDITGTRVRLEGIDAPEMAQSCGRPAGSWECGKAAAEALRRMTANREVSCEDRGADTYGRMLGVCFIDGRDINAELVRAGLAWAFVKYSQSYVGEEAQARAAHLGIWQGAAQPAWEFRARRWSGAEATAPQGCAIKGNISANGRIYHMPWSVWYDKVRIDPANGERWFCSEAEALAAGWRPVGAH